MSVKSMKRHAGSFVSTCTDIIPYPQKMIFIESIIKSVMNKSLDGWKKKLEIFKYVDPLPKLPRMKMELEIIELDDGKVDDGAMRCQSCQYSILSKKHREKCITTAMWQSKTQKVNSEFKPMMTYGLGGCTAINLTAFDSTGRIISNTLAHDPERNIIYSTFNRKYQKDHQYHLVIKIQEEYSKKPGDKYYTEDDTQIKNIQNYFSIYPKVKVKVITYSGCRCWGVDFNSTLYVRFQDGKLQYTDNRGNYQEIAME